MATTELEKLLAQQEDIARKILEAKQKEREPVIAEIKARIAQYGITAKELGFKTKAEKARKESAVVTIRYQNEDGLTWSGRGRTPGWLKGPNGEVSEKLKKKYSVGE